MQAWELGGLAVLALVDSTSFGTLLIPLWMMLAPRVRPGRVLLFLATVALAYLAIGLLLLAGVEVLADVAASLAESRAVTVAQLVVGGVLLAWSFRLDDGPREPSARAQRWQGRLTGTDTAARTTITIALTATLLEVATMLPYLAAIGLLSASSLEPAVRSVALVGYVVVMVLPALLLLALRLAARRAVEPWLERLSVWLAARAGSIVGWVVGIVGFLLAADAAGRLWG